MELIASHISADFDALASLVAASKLYPNARLVFPGSQILGQSIGIFTIAPTGLPSVGGFLLTLIFALLLIGAGSRGRARKGVVA